MSWSHPGADPFASIRYAATLSPDGVGCIRLRYMARGESMDYRVRLVTTRPNYGGLRWWFLCPVSAERGIEKRAAKLYLPPGAKVFGCREAHDLTYQSCRESWQFRGCASPRCRRFLEHKRAIETPTPTTTCPQKRRCEKCHSITAPSTP